MQTPARALHVQWAKSSSAAWAGAWPEPCAELCWVQLLFALPLSTEFSSWGKEGMNVSSSAHPPGCRVVKPGALVRPCTERSYTPPGKEGCNHAAAPPFASGRLWELKVKSDQELGLWSSISCEAENRQISSLIHRLVGYARHQLLCPFESIGC